MGLQNTAHSADLLPPGANVLNFSTNSYLYLKGASNYPYQSSNASSQTNNFPTNSLSIYLWLSWVTPDEGDQYSEGSSTPSSAPILNYGGGPEPGIDEDHRLYISQPSNLKVSWNGSNIGNTGINVADGNWHQIVITMEPFDSSNYLIKIYQNGFLRTTKKLIHDSDITLKKGGRFILGQKEWGDGYEHFMGQFADLFVWDHVRTEQEIKDDFQLLLDNDEEGMVIYWPLHEAPSGAHYDNLDFPPIEGYDYGFDFS